MAPQVDRDPFIRGSSGQLRIRPAVLVTTSSYGTRFDVDAIRSKFPALRAHVDVPVYFDGPAGTQVPDHVISRMLQALTDYRANVNGRFPTSAKATMVIDEARSAVADLFNAALPGQIIFGPNMTSLTFGMSRALAGRFGPSDELVITGMQHDGNVSPWLHMAEERGMPVHRVDFDPATYELDLEQLDRVLSPATALVAINYASNVLGTITDAGEICRRAAAFGAITYVDAVQYAPHAPIDVRSLGCDLLVASPYKFYGPHLGVLYGRRELLEELQPPRLRVAPSNVPDRFETGVKSLEGISGTLGAIEYLEWVGGTFGTPTPDPDGTLRPRTRTLHSAFAAMTQYETPLTAALIQGLQSLKGVKVHGITDVSDFERRVPTVSISVSGIDNAALASYLGEQGIYVWEGHVYAPDVIERLGLEGSGGIVRFGLTHYNTMQEVDRAVAAVESHLNKSSI